MFTDYMPERLYNGGLPEFAWPGGYPFVYVFADGGICCPACANGGNGSNAAKADLDPDCPDDKQWIIVGAIIHANGPPEYCDHCNAIIDSSPATQYELEN